MSRNLLFSRFYYSLIGIALVSIPFTPLLFYFITPLLLIFWIVEGDWKNKWIRFKESPVFIITCCLALFWFVNLLGLSHSNYLVRGVMRTFDKLPFLVFPLLFFTLNKSFFTQRKIYTLLHGFLIAVVVMLCISWGNAILQYSITGKTSVFYYIHLTKYFGHPSYCSMIVCIAFTVASYYFTHSQKTQASFLFSPVLYRLLLVGVLVFCALSIYFFQSRAGFLAFIVVLIFSSFLYFYTYKKSFLYALAGLLILFFVTAFILNSLPNRAGRFFKVITTKDVPMNSILGSRSNIWNKTYTLAKEHKWLGIGTGYYPDSYVIEEDVELLAKHNTFINAHNQFLQTFLEHGILGFFVLLFLVVYSFYFAFKKRDYLLFMLMINVFINLFFESMFERAHGIFAFTLFYCIFIVKNNIFALDFKKMKCHNKEH